MAYEILKRSKEPQLFCNDECRKPRLVQTCFVQHTDHELRLFRLKC